MRDAHAALRAELSARHPFAGQALLVIGVLTLVVATGWVYLGWATARMAEHVGWAALGPGMSWIASHSTWLGLGADCIAKTASLGAIIAAPGIGSWDLVDAGRLLMMWLGMLIAMMLPSAAPAVAAFVDLNRRAFHGRDLWQRIGLFVGGYLAVWSGFGVAATGLQWYLHDAAWLSAGMVAASAWLGGGLLLLAGAYQWSRLKDACLSACRNPLLFFFGHWRDGLGGAWHMGVRHGMVCVGCCWALMTLMFVGGVMNLVWIAALALAMLAEKILPHGDWVGRMLGVALVGMGLAMLVPEALALGA